MTREDQLGQLANAEEHLRRAILESYAKAAAIQAVKALTLLEDYKTTVLPLRNSILHSAPDLTSITAKLRTINDLRKEGRKAKAQNHWDEKWEAGVKSLISAFNELTDLHHTLDGYLIQARQVRESRKTTTLAWWALIATILCLIFTAISGYLYYRPH